MLEVQTIPGLEDNCQTPICTAARNQRGWSWADTRHGHAGTLQICGWDKFSDWRGHSEEPR